MNEQESCFFDLDMAEETLDSLVHLAQNGFAEADKELDRRLNDVSKFVDADTVKDWNEEDHPRDDHGRFGEGGGGSDKPETTSSPRQGMGDVPISDKMLADLNAPARSNDQVPSTAAAFIENGQFNEERTALHDEIVERALEGIEPTIGMPTFYMLGGGPASGKSYAVKTGVADVPSKTEAVHINPDELKEQLPEVHAMQAAGSPDWAGASHEESSYIASRIQAAAQERGISVVLDGTGDTSVDKLSGKIEAARNAGYQVNGVYVSVPTELAVDRAVARALDPKSDSFGRVVDESIIRDTHTSVSQILPQVLDKFDNVQLIDNRDKPTVIMTATGGNVTIQNESLYNEFVGKGKG